MQKKNTNYILVNSIGRGGAERQISYIASVAEIEKIICIEPLLSYPIPEKKLIFLSKGEGKIYQKIFQLICAPIKLKKFVDKNTHVICFLQLSYLLGYIIKIITGCKYSIAVRTNPWSFYEFDSGLKLPFKIYTFLLKRANYIICNSLSTSMEIHSKLKLQKMPITIPNGYDTEKICALSHEPIEDALNAVFENNKVFISVGRLYDEKGHWHLLRIFSEIKKKNMASKLFILGKGPLLHENEKLCTELNLSYYSYGSHLDANNTYDVYFLGFVQNPYKYIKKSYLFLFPSIFEGLPNSPIEALICGVPCFLSDCKTGPREILFPNSDLNKVAERPEISKYGFLMPPFSGEKIYSNSPLNNIENFWVSCIHKCIDSPEYYANFKNNLEEVKQTYSLEYVQKKWIDFFHEAENLFVGNL